MKMAELGEKLVVYRDSGFFFLTAQNSLVEPFAVDPRYTGGRVADFRNTIITVSGNHHLFMGNSGVYMINRSSLEPKPVPIFELGPPFWQIVPPELSEFVYSVDNPVTREIFINCPLGYKTNSQGEYIDDLGNKTNVPCLDWGVIAYMIISMRPFRRWTLLLHVPQQYENQNTIVSAQMNYGSSWVSTSHQMIYMSALNGARIRKRAECWLGMDTARPNMERQSLTEFITG